MTTIEQQLYDKSNPRREYTEADGEQFAQAEKALGENGFDIYGPGANHNAALTDAFFQANRNNPVTVDNIYRAVSERKSEFIWLTQAQADWYRTAQQNIDLANSLPAFLAAQGQPGRLANNGDALFENLLLLFNELHARRETASTQTIQNAEDRISHRPGKQLLRVAHPRRTEPMSRAAKLDDGKPFLGGDDLVKQADGSYRSKTPSEQRRDAEIAAHVSQRPSKPMGPEDAWETLCNELLRFGTHSAQANMRELYDRGIQQGKSFRQIHAEMNALRASYQRLITTAKY